MLPLDWIGVLGLHGLLEEQERLKLQEIWELPSKILCEEELCIVLGVFTCIENRVFIGLNL